MRTFILSKKFRVIVTPLFFVVAFFLLYETQKMYDQNKSATSLRLGDKFADDNGGEFTYILPESVMSYIHFGFRNVLADYYWITAIQNSGLSIFHRNTFLNYYYNITTLDPHFSYPYTFAILWLPNKKLPGSLEAVVPLAERGISAIPDNWEIPYYLAFQYQIIEKSFDKTGKYLAIAASRKDVPDMVKNAYRGFIKRLDRDSDYSEELLKVAYETTKNVSLKRFAADQLFVSYLTKAINSSLSTYKKKYGVYPNSLEELAKVKILSVPPEYYQKFDIAYASRFGNVSITIKPEVNTN